MQESQLKEDEKEFIYRELALIEHDVRFAGWISKKHGKSKVDPRILLLTNYRIYTIKRNALGQKKIRRQAHLYDLKEVVSHSPTEAVLKFREFDCEIQSDITEQIILRIMHAVLDITYGWPEDIPVKYFFQPIERIKMPTLATAPPGGGIIKTYRAYCNYYDQRDLPEIIAYLENVIKNNSTTLDLAEIPGMDANTSSLNYSQLQPFFNALRYNSYFKTLTLKNVNRRELMPLIADTMRYNYTISTLIVSRVHAVEAGFIALGEAMRFNKRMAITYLDLSYNLMDNKGIVGLAIGLKDLAGHLSYLNVASNNFGPKGAAQLMIAIKSNQNIWMHLRELIIGNNKFDREGSQGIQAFLFGPQGHYIETLNFSNIQLDVAFVAQSFKNAHSVAVLDLSQNKMQADAAQTLAHVLESTERITNVNISGCGLIGTPGASIFISFLNNHNIKNAKINLSDNPLGLDGITQLCTRIRQGCPNLSCLKLCNMGTKTGDLLQVLAALETCTSLTELHLDRNIIKGKDGDKFITSVLKLLVNNPGITTLSIAGTGLESKYYIGKDLIKLLESLANNRIQIIELNITGNRIGDNGATALSDALKSNTKLRALRWDSNQISLRGFQFFLTSLQYNNTLCKLGRSTKDLEFNIKNKSQARLKEKLEETLAKIQIQMHTIYDQLIARQPKANPTLVFGEDWDKEENDTPNYGIDETIDENDEPDSTDIRTSITDFDDDEAPTSIKKLANLNDKRLSAQPFARSSTYQRMTYDPNVGVPSLSVPAIPKVSSPPPVVPAPLPPQVPPPPSVSSQAPASTSSVQPVPTLFAGAMPNPGVLRKSPSLRDSVLFSTPTPFVAPQLNPVGNRKVKEQAVKDTSTFAIPPLHSVANRKLASTPASTSAGSQIPPASPGSYRKTPLNEPSPVVAPTTNGTTKEAQPAMPPRPTRPEKPSTIDTKESTPQIPAMPPRPTKPDKSPTTDTSETSTSSAENEREAAANFNASAAIIPDEEDTPEPEPELELEPESEPPESVSSSDDERAVKKSNPTEPIQPPDDLQDLIDDLLS